MTTIKIIPNPSLGWCATCHQSWRPTMIAVRLPGLTVCGQCVTKAARLVDDEQAARDSDAALMHGQDAAGGE